MASTEHVRKRPFQPSTIDAYFSPSSHIFGSADSVEPRQPLRAPVLSDAVQSSLLSVGMRIRKAVPEGYKTQKTLSEPRPALAVASSNGLNTRTSTFRSTELTPFCGLFKVGGLRVPDSDRSSAPVSATPTTNWSTSFADAWSLPSSQESNISVADPEAAPPLVSSVKGNKRAFVVEEEDEIDSDLDDDLFASLDGPMEPTFDVGLPTRRVFARPRGKWRGGMASINVNINDNTDAMDFEEADFLRWDQMDVV